MTLSARARLRRWVLWIDWYMVIWGAVVVLGLAWFYDDWRWVFMGAGFYALGWMTVAWFGDLFLPHWPSDLIIWFWKWWNNRSTRRK